MSTYDWSKNLLNLGSSNFWGGGKKKWPRRAEKKQQQHRYVQPAANPYATSYYNNSYAATTPYVAPKPHQEILTAIKTGDLAAVKAAITVAETHLHWQTGADKKALVETWAEIFDAAFEAKVSGGILGHLAKNPQAQQYFRYSDTPIATMACTTDERKARWQQVRGAQLRYQQTQIGKYHQHFVYEHKYGQRAQINAAGEQVLQAYCNKALYLAVLQSRYHLLEQLSYLPGIDSQAATGDNFLLHLALQRNEPVLIQLLLEFETVQRHFLQHGGVSHYFAAPKTDINTKQCTDTFARLLSGLGEEVATQASNAFKLEAYLCGLMHQVAVHRQRAASDQTLQQARNALSEALDHAQTTELLNAKHVPQSVRKQLQAWASTPGWQQVFSGEPAELSTSITGLLNAPAGPKLDAIEELEALATFQTTVWGRYLAALVERAAVSAQAAQFAGHLAQFRSWVQPMVANGRLAQVLETITLPEVLVQKFAKVKVDATWATLVAEEPEALAAPLVAYLATKQAQLSSEVGTEMLAPGFPWQQALVAGGKKVLGAAVERKPEAKGAVDRFKNWMYKDETKGGWYNPASEATVQPREAHFEPRNPQSFNNYLIEPTQVESVPHKKPNGSFAGLLTLQEIYAIARGTAQAQAPQEEAAAEASRPQSSAATTEFAASETLTPKADNDQIWSDCYWSEMQPEDKSMQPVEPYPQSDANPGWQADPWELDARAMALEETKPVTFREPLEASSAPAWQAPGVGESTTTPSVTHWSAPFAEAPAPLEVDGQEVKASYFTGAPMDGHEVKAIDFSGLDDPQPWREEKKWRPGQA